MRRGDRLDDALGRLAGRDPVGVGNLGDNGLDTVVAGGGNSAGQAALFLAAADSPPAPGTALSVWSVTS